MLTKESNQSFSFLRRENCQDKFPEFEIHMADSLVHMI